MVYTLTTNRKDNIHIKTQINYILIKIRNHLENAIDCEQQIKNNNTMSHQLNIILIHKHEKEVLDGLFVLSKITIFRKLITRNKRRSTMIEPEQEYQYIMLAQYPQFVIYVFYHYCVMLTSRQKEILFAWPFLHSCTFFLVIDSLYSFKKRV